jgi:hypothetical protein
MNESNVVVENNCDENVRRAHIFVYSKKSSTPF